FDGPAADRIAGVLHGELDAVDDRLRGGELAALLRKLDAEVDRALAAGARARVACAEHQGTDGRERRDLAEFHSVSSSNARRSGGPDRPRSACPPPSASTPVPPSAGARCVAPPG